MYNTSLAGRLAGGFAWLAEGLAFPGCSAGDIGWAAPETCCCCCDTPPPAAWPTCLRRGTAQSHLTCRLAAWRPDCFSQLRCVRARARNTCALP